MNVAPEQGLERMKARARALRKRGPSVAGDISANPRETFGGISIRDRFGKLTVIRRAENKGQHARWECVCDCTPGQTIVVRGDHLRDGSTLSCGCAQKQYQEIRITKAEKSLRLKNFGKVPLTARAASILAERKATATTEYVWTLKGGNRLDKNYASRLFHNIAKGLDMPWDCVLHSMRHSFCTRLGERGADPITIRQLAGHASIVISSRYVHPTGPRLESAITMLEGASTVSVAL